LNKSLAIVVGLLCAGSAAAAPSAARAEALAPALTDQSIAKLGGGTLLLERDIQDEVIGDSQVRIEFDRLGLETACAIYNRSLDKVVAKHGPQYTRLLAAAMRQHVPADVLASRIVPSLEHAPLIAYRKRILDSLAGTSGGLINGARSELRQSFLSAAVRTEPAGGAGIFADWDLEKPLARKIACSLLGGSVPGTLAQRKIPFDGFFQRKDTR
jgi:hypothetical protein